MDNSGGLVKWDRYATIYSMVTKEAKRILRSKKLLTELYKRESIWYSAKELGVGLTTLRRWLDRHGIKRHGKVVNIKKPRIREKKTYSFQLANGYRYVKKPEWKKERAEHRVVMEESLGRPLLRSEVVHHINGVKFDNRIENLHLFNNNTQHKISEQQLMEIAYSLYEAGVIKFVDGEYLYGSAPIPFLNLGN